MERSSGNRFRLIYLKSIGAEKSTSDGYSLSEDFKEKPKRTFSFSGAPDSFSSKAYLEQAKADLRHPDSKVRILALRYLEGEGSSIALPLLQEALSDRDPEVRAQALRSLITFRNPMAVPLLRKYLKDSSPKVRMAALRGIFQYREGTDLNIFLQLMSDESMWVRRKMATLLGWTQIEGALPVLMELSKDANPRVRKAALFSLMSLYPEEGEDRLVKAMTDPDPNLRTWVKTILEKRSARPKK